MNMKINIFYPKTKTFLMYSILSYIIHLIPITLHWIFHLNKITMSANFGIIGVAITSVALQSSETDEMAISE